MEQTPIIRTKIVPDMIPGLKVPRLNYYIRNEYFIPIDEAQGQGAQRFFMPSELYVIGVLHALTEKGIDLNKTIIPAFKKNRAVIVEQIKTAMSDDVLVIQGDKIELSKKEYTVPSGSKGDWTPVIILPVGRIIMDINERLEKRRQGLEKFRENIRKKKQEKK